MNYITPTIINIKITNLRKIYNNNHNIEKWIDSLNNLYIGRGMRIFIGNKENKKAYYIKCSKYFNPFKVNGNNRCLVLKQYEEYARKTFSKEEILKDLNNQTLGCWCKPEGCHGDVLIKLFNEYKKK